MKTTLTCVTLAALVFLAGGATLEWEKTYTSGVYGWVQLLADERGGCACVLGGDQIVSLEKKVAELWSTHLTSGISSWNVRLLGVTKKKGLAYAYTHQGTTTFVTISKTLDVSEQTLPGAKIATIFVDDPTCVTYDKKGFFFASNVTNAMGDKVITIRRYSYK